jgi:hypothetical protein
LSPFCALFVRLTCLWLPLPNNLVAVIIITFSSDIIVIVVVIVVIVVAAIVIKQIELHVSCPLFACLLVGLPGCGFLFLLVAAFTRFSLSLFPVLPWDPSLVSHSISFSQLPASRFRVL